MASFKEELARLDKTASDNPNNSSFLRHLGRTAATAVGGAAGHLMGMPLGSIYGMGALPPTESVVGKLGPFQRKGGAIGAGLGAALANYMSSGSAGTVSDALSAGLGAAAGSYATNDSALPGGYFGSVLGEPGHVQTVMGGNHKDPQFWRSLGTLGGGAAAGGILGDTANRMRRTLSEKDDEKQAEYGAKQIKSDLHAALHEGLSEATGRAVTDRIMARSSSPIGQLSGSMVGGMIGDPVANAVLGEPEQIAGHPFLTGTSTYLAGKGLEHLINRRGGVNLGPLPVRDGVLAAGGEFLGRSTVRAYDEGMIPSPLRPIGAAGGAMAGQLLGILGAGALARKLNRPVSFDPLRAGAALGAGAGGALGDYLSAGFTGDASLRDALITGLGAGTGAALAHKPGGGKLTGAMPGALAGVGAAHLVNKATGGKKEKAPKKKTYREYSEE